MSYCFYSLLLLLQLPLPLLAQVLPPSERLISVDLRQAPLAQALNQISQAGGFVFAYNPAQIPSCTITICRTHAPVREILDQVFKGGVAYRSRGNYLILTRQSATSGASSRPRPKLTVDRSQGNRAAPARSVAQIAWAPVPPLTSLTPGPVRGAAATGRPLLFFRSPPAVLPGGSADSTRLAGPTLGEMRNQPAWQLRRRSKSGVHRDTIKVKPAKFKPAKIKKSKIKPAKIKPAKIKVSRGS